MAMMGRSGGAAFGCNSMKRTLVRMGAGLALALGLGWFGPSALAQSIDPSLIKQFETLRKGGASGVVERNSPLDQVRERSANRESGSGSTPQIAYVMRSMMPSLLEEDYERRSGEALEQFGYDMFALPASPADVITGQVPEGYILGVGDTLIVTLQGSTPQTISTAVDREGRVIIEGLPPIPAAGRSFGEVRDDIRARTSEAMIGTEAHVSLGAFRMASVYVLGEVEQPGLQRVTSLTDLFEVLSYAGGIKKTGSLRDIRIISGGKTQVVDLYRVMDGRSTANINLSDGARVIVPVIGPTAAVFGGVARPGIYELSRQEKLTQSALLALAGGGLRPRGYAYVLNRIGADGRQQISTLTNLNQPVEDGDLLSAGLRDGARVGGVELVGHVRTPGLRSVSAAPTIAALLGDGHEIKDYPYLIFGVVETSDPRTRARLLKPFSPEKVLSGAENFALHDKDRVILFGRQDIDFLSLNLTRRVVLTGHYAPTEEAGEQCRPLQELSHIVSDTKSDRYATAVRAVFVQLDVTDEDVGGALGTTGGSQGVRALANAEQQTAGLDTQMVRMPDGSVAEVPLTPEQELLKVQRARQIKREEQKKKAQDNPACPLVYQATDGLLPYVLEYVVSADGAVRRPGVYPLVEGTPLASLVATAGGTTYNVDLSKVELSAYMSAPGQETASYSRRVVNALDTDLAAVTIGPAGGVRFNSRISEQEAGAVLLGGEVMRPGVYTIRRGERLSELIERAGGLTEQAYPYGAVFTRTRVKEAQEAGFKRTARELNQGLATAALMRKNLSPETLLAGQALAERISTVDVIGRVVIEADPRVLAEKPALDTVLEPGDRLVVPKRPNYVLAIGDILNPGALQFISGKEAKEYLREAGGVLPTADDGRIFVVYPNGVARPIKLSSWGFSSGLQVPPGTTIVVPKDVAPIDVMEMVRDITAIFSQLAVSAASIAVISR